MGKGSIWQSHFSDKLVSSKQIAVSSEIPDLHSEPTLGLHPSILLTGSSLQTALYPIQCHGRRPKKRPDTIKGRIHSFAANKPLCLYETITLLRMLPLQHLYVNGDFIASTRTYEATNCKSWVAFLHQLSIIQVASRFLRLQKSKCLYTTLSSLKNAL